MNEKLKRGQIVLIKNERFKVIGMIEFKEDTWIWQEYKIVSNSNKIRWLSVEEVEGKIQYSIYDENYRVGNVNAIEHTYNNRKYSLYEQGIAHVKSYYGSVDVDINEKVVFKEYLSEDKKYLISIEDWNGDIEKSTGEYIDNSEINITQEFEKTNLTHNMSTKGLKAFFIILFSIIGIGIVGGTVSSKNAMSNYIEKSSDFKYVTSVTNNENNKKAKVYKTDLTIEETVKKIIDGLPEKVKKVTQSDEDEEGIGLFTSSEYAYVYESDDGETYVQVSSKKYMNSSGNAYHSRYRNRGYYRTFTTNNTHSSYTSYLNSARQASINARRSSGGGTSSGK